MCKVLIATVRAEREDSVVWYALYDKAVTMAEAQEVQPSKPRTVRQQQQQHDNVPADSISEY